MKSKNNSLFCKGGVYNSTAISGDTNAVITSNCPGCSKTEGKDNFARMGPQLLFDASITCPRSCFQLLKVFASRITIHSVDDVWFNAQRFQSKLTKNLVKHFS